MRSNRDGHRLGQRNRHIHSNRMTSMQNGCEVHSQREREREREREKEIGRESE